MILFLYGKDTYRSREQMKRMIEKFQTDRDPSRLNVFIPDIQKESVERIIEEIHASPFLSEKRMVVIRGLLESKQKKLHEVILEKLKDNSFPSSTILLFYEEGDEFGANKTVKELSALLQKEKYAQRFDELAGIKLAQYIEEEVNNAGTKIEKEALQFLVQNAKNDGWLIHSVIDQLVHFTSGRTITLQDVKLFIDEKFDDNIFNLVDAIVEKKGEKVFAMLQEQYKKGEDAIYILSMLSRQFKILLQIKDAIERNALSIGDGAAKSMGIHPFVLKKTTPVARKYSLEELKGIYSQLCTLDVKFKTSGGNPETLLDVFVGRLCLQK